MLCSAPPNAGKDGDGALFHSTYEIPHRNEISLVVSKVDTVENILLTPRPTPPEAPSKWTHAAAISKIRTGKPCTQPAQKSTNGLKRLATSILSRAQGEGSRPNGSAMQRRRHFSAPYPGFHNFRYYPTVLPTHYAYGGYQRYMNAQHAPGAVAPQATDPTLPRLTTLDLPKPASPMPAPNRSVLSALGETSAEVINAARVLAALQPLNFRRMSGSTPYCNPPPDLPSKVQAPCTSEAYQTSLSKSEAKLETQLEKSKNCVSEKPSPRNMLAEIVQLLETVGVPDDAIVQKGLARMEQFVASQGSGGERDAASLKLFLEEYSWIKKYIMTKLLYGHDERGKY